MQFVIFGYDGEDPRAGDRRQAARAAHLERFRQSFESREMLFASALLNENGEMKGSLLIGEFESEDAVQAWLTEEPYVQQGVWQRIEIKRCAVAPICLPATPAGLATSQPTLDTARLRLRPFVLEDAPVVEQLASDRAVAATTARIPHPYPSGAAEQWIRQRAFDDGELVWAIADRSDGTVLGSIGIILDREQEQGTLGYWIGRPYWNRGYATEAVDALLRFGFERLQLRRVMARAYSNNPASARVLEKCGLRLEGTFRKEALKWGEELDVNYYAILRGEYGPAAEREEA